MTLLSLDITIQIVKCYWSSGAELVNFCTRLHSPPVWRQHSILLPTSPPPQTQSKAKSSVAFGPPALTETPAHVVTQSGRVWSHGGGGGFPFLCELDKRSPRQPGCSGGVPGRAAGGGGGAEPCPRAGASTPASSAPAPGWGRGGTPCAPRGAFFYPYP